MKDYKRRDFLKNSLLGTGATFLYSNGLAKGTIASKNEEGNLVEEKRRNVWIASFTQDGITGNSWKDAIRATVKKMEAAVPFKADVYLFPELFYIAQLTGGRPTVSESAEDGSGRVIAPFQDFAKKHNCYIICPIYTTENNRHYNAAVLIDRKGSVMGEYRKIHPTLGEIEKGISPGPLDPPVFNTDFGTIGIQICYDIEWRVGWNRLAEKGAEVIFWPSAFAGGKKVNFTAMSNQVAVVSSTRKNTTKICDVTGDEVASSGNWSRWGVCAKLNLEKAVLHSWPDSLKFKDIQKKYGRKVNCYSLSEEEFSVIESLSPTIKVKDIIKEFGLTTYRDHIEQATEMQIKIRSG